MADDPRYQIVRSADPVLLGDAEMRRRLAAYLISAVPSYFARVPLNEDALCDAVGEQIGLPSTEYEGAEIAWLGDKAIGLMCWCTVEKLDLAQRAGTIRLMRHIERAKTGQFLTSLAEHGRNVEPFPTQSSGLVITRIGVDPLARGQGIGATLVQRVIDRAYGGDVWLHVARTAEDAMRVYQKAGFTFLSEQPFAMRAMVRRGNA